MNVETKSDLVLLNANVYTMDTKKTLCQAVAIKGKKIVYAGNNELAKTYISDDTKVIDLNGALVLPGFMDAHMHPTIGAPSYMYDIVLNGVVGFDNVMNTIREFVESHPDDSCYGGYGFIRTDYDAVGPRKEWLDKIVSDKPIVLYSDSGHSAWVNSKALEMAGITKDTVPPVGAEISIDPESGEPAGLVKGLEYIKIFDPIKPQRTVEKMKKAYEWLFQWFHKEGLTSVFDAEISLEDLTFYTAYKELADSNALKCRVRGAWMITENVYADLENYLKKAKELSNALQTPYFQMNAVKVFADGIIEEKTAYMLEPYSDADNGWRGEPVWTEEQMKKIFLLADKYGFQIHVHQIGDAAAKQVIDCLEYVQQVNGKRDSRHTIAHLECVTDEDIARMGKLGIEAVVSPEWTAVDQVYVDFYRDVIGDRTDSIYKLRTYLKNGVHISSHCDFNVSDPEIDLRIYSGVTRTIPEKTFIDYYGDGGYTRTTDPNFVNDGKTMGPFHIEEALTIEEVVTSCTSAPSYASFMEDITGTIEAGKFADLVVYEKNFMEYKTMEEMESLCGMKPKMTIFDGNIVYVSEK